MASGAVETVRNQVQATAATAAANNGDGHPTVFDLIKRQKSAIEMALPSHLNSERFTRIALTTVRQNRSLAECDAASLLGALMVSAQLGLEPGGPLGHAYLVPFKREVTFILGYKGIIELARRSGQVSTIAAHEVCEGDVFDYAYGTDSHLTHKPALTGRGKAFAYYAVVKFKDGSHEFVVLSRDDVEAHRKRSRASGNGPWSTDYDAMARKTCIRVLAPYLPLSPELELAIRADERAYRTVEPNMVEQVPALGSGDVDMPPDDEPVDDELVDGEPAEYAPGEEPFTQ